MITVDCRDIESIKNELLIYVADNVGALPALKLHEFMLAPIDDSETVSNFDVVTAIKEFLDSIGEIKNFAVITQGDIIHVKSISGKQIIRESKTSANVDGMFSCTHCGFMTQYEIEYQNHLKIHYL